LKKITLRLSLAVLSALVCIADINEVDLESAASDIDGDVLTVKTNVSNLSDIESLRDQVLAHWGEVNLLMNDVGITRRGAGPWTGLDEWQKIINTNLWGIVNSVQTFLPVHLLVPGFTYTGMMRKHMS
jgi:NAD(P)-dependent dehydrogenase (short-subunit alcohol dehydrogenase family)